MAVCFTQVFEHDYCSKTDIPQGSAVTRLRCGGIFGDYFTANFSESAGEIILKIVQHLAKLQASVNWHLC